MTKFILGYEAENSDELKHYSTKMEADNNSEEWCEVEAETLEAAKEKYEEAFKNWQASQ